MCITPCCPSFFLVIGSYCARVDGAVLPVPVLLSSAPSRFYTMKAKFLVHKSYFTNFRWSIHDFGMQWKLILIILWHISTLPCPSQLINIITCIDVFMTCSVMYKNKYNKHLLITCIMQNIFKKWWLETKVFGWSGAVKRLLSSLK